VKERFAPFRAKAIHYWKQASRTQKTALISTIVLFFVVLAITVINLSKTEYSYAFTDLDPSDSAAITTYLIGQGIPYQLSGDGRSIGVPTTSATQVKIDVESQGLVTNGSIGYGIFKDNISSFGMTDNEFNVLKTDAVAGEIQQLINSMEGVSKSKVVIVVPTENVFIRDTQELSSASAVITFKRGYRPDQKLIDTIYNLVIHSLPKINQENITISDQQGELLSSSKMGGGLGNSSSLVAEQFLIKKQFETEIQRNIQLMLNKIFPPEKVVVSVISTLNFDKKNSVEQIVKPVNETNNKGIEISVEKIQESYSSEGGSTGGVPGTGEGDVPGYPTTDSGGRSESESLTERINYDVNRISNEIVSAPFQVKDLTVNVAVEPPANDPASIIETKSAIQQILSNIVAASLADSGKNYTEEEINKKVFVLAHSFDGVQEENVGSIFSSALFYGLGAIALAVILVGAFMVFRRRKADELYAEELLPQALSESTPDLDTVRSESQVRTQLESLARKKPEEFVNLLRTWLVDD